MGSITFSTSGMTASFSMDLGDALKLIRRLSNRCRGARLHEGASQIMSALFLYMACEHTSEAPIPAARSPESDEASWACLYRSA